MKRTKIITNEIRFVFANCFSAFGSGLTYMMFILLLAQRRSLTYSSTIIGAYLCINIVSMLLSGIYIDEKNKGQLLRLIQGASFVFMVAVAFFYLIENEMVMFFLFCCLGGISGIDANLTSSILPEIVEKNKVRKINAYIQLGGRFFGIYVGSIAVWCADSSERFFGAFLFDAFTYLIAYYAYGKIRYEGEIRNSKGEKTNLKLILLSVFQDARIIRNIIAVVLVNIALGPFDTLVPRMLESYGWGIKHYGYINTAFSSGAFLVVVLLFTKKERAKHNMLAIEIVAFGATLLAFSVVRVEWVIYLLVGIAGFLSVVLLIDTKSYVQLNTQYSNMGKIMAIMSVLLKLAKPIGIFVSNIIARHTKGYLFFVVMSVILIFYSIIIGRGGEENEGLPDSI